MSVDQAPEPVKQNSRKRGRPSKYTPEQRAEFIRESSVMRPALFRKHKKVYEERIAGIQAAHEAKLAEIQKDLDIALQAILRVTAILAPAPPTLCNS